MYKIRFLFVLMCSVLPALALADLPAYARATYQITWGSASITVATMVQEIRQTGQRYYMRSSVETAGLASMFKDAGAVNVSQGEVVANTLRPEQFSLTRRDGKTEKVEKATFDWAAGEVHLDSGQQFTLESGTQDLFSMFGQLMLAPLDTPSVTVPVVTRKGVEHYEFTVVGEETIKIPLGTVATLHIVNHQPDSKETTDIWLGLNYSRLPVRIRMVDRKGGIAEQSAKTISFDAAEGAR